MALTAEQIRAQAANSLGASSSLAVATGNPAPSTVPGAATTDQVQPAPAIHDPSPQATIEALQVQLAQALAVIATIQPTAVAAVAGERTYHSNVPFIKIHYMKGPGICESAQFRDHKMSTDDPHAIAFMEATIATGTSGFSHAPMSKKPSPEEVEMKKDVLTAAVIARDKMVAAGEKVA